LALSGWLLKGKPFKKLDWMNLNWLNMWESRACPFKLCYTRLLIPIFKIERWARVLWLSFCNNISYNKNRKMLTKKTSLVGLTPSCWTYLLRCSCSSWRWWRGWWRRWRWWSGEWVRAFLTLPRPLPVTFHFFSHCFYV